METLSSSRNSPKSHIGTDLKAIFITKFDKECADAYERGLATMKGEIVNTVQSRQTENIRIPLFFLAKVAAAHRAKCRYNLKIPTTVAYVQINILDLYTSCIGS